MRTNSLENLSNLLKNLENSNSNSHLTHPIKKIARRVNNHNTVPFQVKSHCIKIGSYDCYVIKIINRSTSGKRMVTILVVKTECDGVQFRYNAQTEPTQEIYDVTLYFKDHKSNKEMKIEQITDEITPGSEDIQKESESVRELNKRMKDTPFEIAIGDLYEITKTGKTMNCVQYNNRPNVHIFSLASSLRNNRFMLVDDYYICIKNRDTQKCEASILCDKYQLLNESMVEISSKTNLESYKNMGLNKFLRAVTFKVINELFPNVNSIISYASNNISKYVMIKYFKANTTNNMSTENERVEIDVIKKFIELEKRQGTMDEFLMYMGERGLIENTPPQQGLGLGVGVCKKRIFPLLKNRLTETVYLRSNVDTVLKSKDIKTIIDNFVDRMKNNNQKKEIKNIEKSRLSLMKRRLILE